MFSWTQLLYALKTLDKDSIKQMLKRDNGNLTYLALDRELNNKNEDLVEFIRENSPNMEEAIKIGMKNGNTEIIDYELSKGYSINDLANIAATIDDLDIIKYLEGKDIPNRKTFYSDILRTSINSGNIDIISYALSKGAEITQHQIDEAILGKQPRVLQYLLDVSGIQPDSTMLKIAIERSFPDVLVVLLENGAKIGEEELKIVHHMINSRPKRNSPKQVLELLKEYMPKKL